MAVTSKRKAKQDVLIKKRHKVAASLAVVGNYRLLVAKIEAQNRIFGLMIDHQHGPPFPQD